ncbi:MAG: hypothetical protein KatS3mg085_446 [Candidatus Dojkabacteria bacterium]|nr:MAG: hypothetical protein KatS3mg085_446 [Candidatus Dojkabacteria bacterium]
MANSLYKTTANARKILFAFLVFSLLIVVNDFYQSLSKTQTDFGLNSQRRFYMSTKFFDFLDDIPPVPDIPGIPRDTNDSLTYSVEGVFSEFPDISYVYTIEEPAEKLLTFQNAQNIASELGFNSENFSESGQSQVVWSKDNGATTLTFDRVLQTWNMKTDLTNNPRFNPVQKIVQNRLNNLSLTLLSRIRLNGGKGFNNGLSENIFLKREANGDLVEVTDSNQAQLILSNAYRILPLADLKPQSEQPELLPGEVRPRPVSAKVYTSDPFRGSANFLTKGSEPEDDIYEFSFINWEYGVDVGAYPIITPQEAWNNVQQGQGSLVFIRQQGDSRIGGRDPLNVRRYVLEADKTEIAFYEPSEWNGFVTPVYIFRGRAELENGRQASFIFYIDALKRL